MKQRTVVIIGGGAAGFFAAISCAEANPDCKVIIIEKSNKLLSKVRISGGGRCNVTHACFENSKLIKNYPRGERELKSVFNSFTTTDTINWFEKRGVKLKTEADGRMFPTTESSETIIKCLLNEASKYGISIWTGTTVQKITKNDQSQFILALNNDNNLLADKLLIATGGNPSLGAYDIIKQLGHSIEAPVPSLFTFNIQDKDLHQLAGISVTKADVKISGIKLNYVGPLLITHWGLSGPAVLKLSAFGARILAEKRYEYEVRVNWIYEYTVDSVKEALLNLKNLHSKKLVVNTISFELPRRLWEYLLIRAEITDEKKWADLSTKQLNKLSEMLCNCTFQAKGKTTYKDEFVTCGGISLKEIDFKTMESLMCKGLYFAGEVLDIDGITGGFNFQNAWTTGWVAGKAMAL